AFPLKDCARCHHVKEIVYKVKATGTTNFSHKKHLTSTPDCGTCHPKLFAAGKNKSVSMAEMERGKSCGACHNGTKAFGIDKCTACHPTRDRNYAVKGAGNVHFRHGQHIGKYSCSSCHTKLYGISGNRSAKAVNMKAMEKGKSCGACHDGKQAFTVKQNCATCHKAK
ncbi:cytochrome c3 family protein, partial [Pelotalea chapellei]